MRAGWSFLASAAGVRETPMKPRAPSIIRGLLVEAQTICSGAGTHFDRRRQEESNGESER